MNAEHELQKIRTQIDALDQQLQQLINRRAELALDIRNIKKIVTEKPIFYRPEREAQILQTISARQHGPLTAEQMIAIFRPLLTTCLSLQESIKVAYLGPEGSFSHLATLKHFGPVTNIVSAATIADVFHAVTSAHTDYGIVPIENSTTGMINTTLDLLAASTTLICGETLVPIHMCLLSNATDPKQIAKIYGHEQAFLQCQQWLENHYPDAEKITLASNSAAAQRVVDEKNSAAIAAEVTSELYSLPLLARNIEDNPANETRFLVLGREKVPITGNDKTTLLIYTPHRAGALVDFIQPFATYGVNLTHITSRPALAQQWSYGFFIDLDGHQDEPTIQQALHALKEKAVMVNLLGSYPKAR